MASAAELAALATVINVQAPAALAEALKEIQRLREEVEQQRKEFRELKVAALRGNVYVNPMLDPNRRHMQTWREVANDLGDEAQMAWDYAERLERQVETLREQVAGQSQPRAEDDRL